MLISAIFGIILAVAFIVIHKKLFSEKFEFKLIETEIESYNNKSTKRGKRLNSASPDDEFGFDLGLGFLDGVTLKDIKTGERSFVESIQFRKVLWRNIGATDFRQRKCIFCTQKFFLRSFRVFATKFIDDPSSPGFAFLDDLCKPRSIPGIIFGIIWRLFFLFFTMIFIFPGFIRADVTMVFFPLFLLIILIHSLYNFVLSISKRKVALQEQLSLIEHAGIPKPLG